MSPRPQLYDCVHAVAEQVARRHGLPGGVTRLLSTSQQSDVVTARREFFRLVVDSWGLSLSEAERLLGWDRDTIRRGCSAAR